MTSRRNYTAIMLEEIREQNRAILKAVGNMQSSIRHIPPMRADIATLKQDVAVIKFVVRDVSNLVNGHELRIANLESA